MKNKPWGLLNPYRKSIVFILIISSLVNILVLTSPFFMLLIYDIAVPTGSSATLLVLTLLAVILFAFYGTFDFLRGRVMARIGAQMQTSLEKKFLMNDAPSGDMRAGQQSLRDLEIVQQFLSSPVSIALIDVFWSPIFVVVAFIFHPWLGIFSLSAVAILTIIAIISHRLNKQKIAEAQKQATIGDYYAKEYAQNNQVITALGMQDQLAHRWLQARESSTQYKMSSSDQVGAFASFSKTLRLVAQSGILALGAWLVMLAQIPVGMMIAGSILLGRTLAPIDLVIGQWSLVDTGFKALKNVNEKFQNLPEDELKTALPIPKGYVKFEGVYAHYGNPKKMILNNVSFDLEPGKALGVIGPSASGKTSLALVLLGILPPVRGRVDIDGASILQYEPSQLGHHFGYLPQDVTMLSGTVAENISRFDDSDNRDEKVIAAARAADAHDMIVGLEDGYNTQLPGALSGGQNQRIALARALYNQPPILVFDEPNSNLDSDGTLALNKAIENAKARNQSVIIIAHRPAAIQECDYLLVLNKGVVTGFGPRNQVLKNQVQNYKVIAGATNG